MMMRNGARPIPRDGMSPKQKKAVLEVEERDRDRYTEKGYIIGADGKVIGESVNGRSTVCSFYDEDIRKSKDAVMTHNHPAHEYTIRGNKDKKYGLGYSRIKRHERSASDTAREA